ncbi:hypothetical protein [Flavobacterium sp. LS1R10]|uniref:hypothetical protein n=1 Tax=Flavobacterium sp. LS1R10 TaxID=2497482 RepID=UPI000F83A5F6|nr:hypothetical protein [Flavobacterium sp. LS1R10]RTY76397.1 hypothetical protein EKL96_02600 [Flavobacterium sp. LS1R10]
MTTVEKQLKDVPLDMIPHTDASGNVYNFGFGLNWKGVINNDRTAKYSAKKYFFFKKIKFNPLIFRWGFCPILNLNYSSKKGIQ